MGQGAGWKWCQRCFAALTREKRRSVPEMLADSSHVQKAGVTRGRLRGVLEAIGGAPCFREYMTFDIAGDGLGISFWRLGLAAVTEVIWPVTLQSHVRPPGVVPAFEFGAQEHQAVKSLDDRHASQPLVFERLDNPFRYGNGPVYSYGSEARFDAPLFQQFGKGISDEDLGLV